MNAIRSKVGRRWLLALSAFMAFPAIMYGGYYLHVFDDQIWFLELRSIPGSEYLADGLGFFAGVLEASLGKRMPISRGFLLFLLLMGLSAPYLKPVFRPLDERHLREQWEDDVCLQTTASTCGPASAATLLKFLGEPTSEATLAKEAHTSASGTEIWHLVRVLRHRGIQCRFRTKLRSWSKIDCPAIVGVKMATTGSGHFLALLHKAGSEYEIEDPLTGRQMFSESELSSAYSFTGFALELSVSK